MRGRIGKNSVYHIKTNFEWEMIAQRYIQILENKKIAVVISSLRKGGAERIVSDLTLNLPQNWDIDIILNGSKENIEYSFRGNIITLGMKPQKNKLDIVYQYNVLIKRIFLLKKLKKKNNYAVCISFMDSANVANILSGKKYCKVIGTVVFVKKFDLRGVAFGTLAAAVFCTVRMALYVTRNLIAWSMLKVVKQFAVDALTVIVGFLVIRWSEIGGIKCATWSAWVFMAIKVSFLWFVIIILINSIFYRKNIRKIICKFIG